MAARKPPPKIQSVKTGIASLLFKNINSKINATKLKVKK